MRQRNMINVGRILILQSFNSVNSIMKSTEIQISSPNYQITVNQQIFSIIASPIPATMQIKNIILLLERRLLELKLECASL